MSFTLLCMAFAMYPVPGIQHDYFHLHHFPSFSPVVFQGYRARIVDVREEILRKRRAGKLPEGTTTVLKAWWQAHAKWPYPTVRINTFVTICNSTKSDQDLFFSLPSQFQSLLKTLKDMQKRVKDI